MASSWTSKKQLNLRFKPWPASMKVSDQLRQTPPYWVKQMCQHLIQGHLSGVPRQTRLVFKCKENSKRGYRSRLKKKTSCKKNLHKSTNLSHNRLKVVKSLKRRLDKQMGPRELIKPLTHLQQFKTPSRSWLTSKDVRKSSFSASRKGKLSSRRRRSWSTAMHRTSTLKADS